MYTYIYIYIHVRTFIHVYTVLARQHCDSISAGEDGGDEGVKGDEKKPGGGCREGSSCWGQRHLEVWKCEVCADCRIRVQKKCVGVREVGVLIHTHMCVYICIHTHMYTHLYISTHAYAYLPHGGRGRCCRVRRCCMCVCDCV